MNEERAEFIKKLLITLLEDQESVVLTEIKKIKADDKTA